MKVQGCPPLAQLQVSKSETKVICTTRYPHEPSPCTNNACRKNPPSRIGSAPSSYTHTDLINGPRTSVNAPSLDALAEVSAAAKRMLVSSIGWVSLIALGTMTLNTPCTILPYSLKDPRHGTNPLNISATMTLAHEFPRYKNTRARNLSNAFLNAHSNKSPWRQYQLNNTTARS